MSPIQIALDADLLDTYHAGAFPRKAENATITGQWTFSNHVLFSPDNTYDIGASGATRPRTIYVRTQLVVGADLGGGIEAARITGDMLFRSGGAMSFNNAGDTYSAGRFIYNATIDGVAIEVVGGAAVGFKGHFLAVTDNTYDIGASGATRPRHLYLAGLGTFGSSVISRGQDTSELGLAAGYAADPETGAGVATPILVWRSRTGQSVYQLGVTDSTWWVSVGATADATRLLTLGNTGNLTIAGTVTATEVLAATVDSGSATDLLLQRNNVTKVTVTSADIDFVGSVDTDTSFKKSGTQVVAGRITGYTAMTGTADRGTAYATGTITLPQLAERVKAIQDDLTTHGLIGA